ncbi:MAG: peptidoglycan DD-metalloendopeptidase family protein [Actinomycetota bacterium]
MQTPGQPPEPLFERLAETMGRPTTERWWNLSEQVHGAALGPDPGAPVEALQEEAARDEEAPVAPAFRLWAADALGRASREREAVALYDQALIATESAPAFEGIDLEGEALRHRAGALARLGDVDGAVASYRDLAARGEEAAFFRAGVVAERAGRRDQAAELYREIADPHRTPNADNPRQRAFRAMERLTLDGGSYTPSVLGIARNVEAAVAARDADQLRNLASPTHFQAGPGGGHFRFEDDEFLDWLCSDLARSRPRRMGRALLGTGGKRYLLTTGWRGRWFRGIVGFCMMRSARGWEWSGVVVGGPRDPWKQRWAPAEKQTNQPLPFGLLAPWPEGRHFMAGGLDDFLLKSAAIAAAALIPFVGAAAAAALAFGFSLSDCGYGLRGFYYNQGPTHSGSDSFAIDFTAYRRGVPFSNVAGGVPVLTAADGVVRMTDGDTASGDSSDANEVQINHDDPGTGTSRFVSRYLHMAGPGLLPVSAGMAAPTGRRLGVMNDTGTSVLDHLHFSIHDSAAGAGIGPSVRPTPIEGRTLGDGDSGACIRSSNRETIVLPEGCGEVVVDLLRRLLGRR